MAFRRVRNFHFIAKFKSQQTIAQRVGHCFGLNDRIFNAVLREVDAPDRAPPSCFEELAETIQVSAG